MDLTAANVDHHGCSPPLSGPWKWVEIQGKRRCCHSLSVAGDDLRQMEARTGCRILRQSFKIISEVGQACVWSVNSGNPEIHLYSANI